MKIVLIVYDCKKILMIKLVIVYKYILEKYELYVIGMIGMKVMEVIGLFVYCFKLGLLGGD